MKNTYHVRWCILALAICWALFVTGCGEQKLYWAVRNEPTTEAERRAVAEQVAKIMAATPQSLAGNDQDWDDAINAATRSAKQTLCRPTLWQHSGYGNWTGNWQYLKDGQ